MSQIKSCMVERAVAWQDLQGRRRRWDLHMLQRRVKLGRRNQLANKDGVTLQNLFGKRA